jgi:peptidyl-prolyl cis-trans isomerase SurA
MTKTLWISSAALLLGSWGCDRPQTSGAGGTVQAPNAEVALVIDGTPIAREAFVAALLVDQGEAFARRFVERRLVEAAAKAAGATVDQAAIEAALDREVSQLITGRFGGSQAKFDAHIRDYGITMQTWRKNRLVQLRLSALARETMRASQPEAQLKTLFEQRFGEGGVRQQVRHVRISTNVAASRLYTRKDYEVEKVELDRAARAKAAAIHQRLLAGGAFAAEAKAHSDDLSAAKGGQVGAAWAGKYGKAFEDAVARLDVGKISPVISGRQGYHVIQATGVQRGARYEAHLIEIAFDGEGGEAGAQARIKQARTRLAAGDPFGQVAKRWTDGPQNQAKGGKLGAFAPGQQAAEIDTVIETMAVGSVSAPIRTERSFAIVQLDKRTWLPGQDLLLVRHVLVSTQYDKVKARKIEGDLPVRAEAKAKALLAELEAGGDFASIARRNSEAPLTARNGGKIQVYHPGKIGPEVDEALKTMKAGTRRLVRTQQGFEIVELTGTRRVSFEAVQDELRASLKKRRFKEEEVQTWIRAQAAAAKVELKFAH